MTLKDLEDRWLAHFNMDTAAGSSATTRVRGRQYINDWHRNILSRDGFARLRRSTVTFASVAGEPTVALWQGDCEILDVTERTNNTRLTRQTLDWYRSIDSNPTLTTGNPYAWIPLGQAAAASPAATGTGLWVVSSSASDTGTAYIEGTRVGGFPGTANVTMTGVTRAQLGALADWIEVTKFYISAVAVGSVSLYDAAANGNVLSVIPIGKSSARYQVIALEPTPASAITYYADVQRDIPDMSNATDEPLLPADFHQLLLLGAMVSEYERTDDDRYTRTLARLEDGIKRCRYAVEVDGDTIYVPGRQVTTRSVLGPWYPAGS